MTAHTPQPDPLAAVLAMMDAGEALAAAARLATETEDRRRLIGMADGRPLPAPVAAVVDWQAAAQMMPNCACTCWPKRFGRRYRPRRRQSRRRPLAGPPDDARGAARCPWTAPRRSCYCARAAAVECAERAFWRAAVTRAKGAGHAREDPGWLGMGARALAVVGKLWICCGRRGPQPAGISESDGSSQSVLWSSSATDHPGHPTSQDPMGLGWPADCSACAGGGRPVV